MRGAYYVTTALLVVASSRTAAESGQSTQLQIYDHDVMATDNAVASTLLQRFLRESRDIHDDLAPTVVDEERVGSLDMYKFNVFGMDTAANSVVTDAQKAVEAIRDALTKAFEEVLPELQRRPPGDTTAFVDANYNWLNKEWSKMAEESHLQTQKSNDTPGETHAAGHPDTSRKRKHLPSTVKEPTQRQKKLDKMKASPEELRAEVQPKRLSDTATVIDASQNLLSFKRIELLPKIWAKKINLEPQLSEEVSNIPGEAHSHDTSMHFASLSTKINHTTRGRMYTRHRVLPQGKKGPNSYSSYTVDYANLDAIHDAFYQHCSPTYNPTRHETTSLWALANWENAGNNRQQLERLALKHVITNLMTVMEDDSMWKGWVLSTKLQKVQFLNQMLNGHNRRLIWMYNKFIEKRPDIPKTTTSSEPATNEFQSSIGESSKFAPLVLEKSQNPPLVEPTSSELITKDFLTNFGKHTQPSVDAIIGKNSD